MASKAEVSGIEVEELSLEQESNKGKKKKFDIEDFIFRNRFPLTFLLGGLILIGLGVIVFKVNLSGSPKIEVLESSTNDRTSEIIVEVAGAVEKPGVYKLSSDSRVEDLLIASGGLSAGADRGWVRRMLNRASKLTDGQKFYIPSKEELAPSQSHQTIGASAKNDDGNKKYQGGVGNMGGDLVNINTASQKLLEELPGIGPVYAQSIIEHRPYSSVEELVSRNVLKKNVYEKIKDSVTVY